MPPSRVRIPPSPPRRGGRAVECGGLENRFGPLGPTRVQIPPPPSFLARCSSWLELSRRMFGAEQRDIDQIAEYADSTVRQMVRTGSLAPIAGRRGVNAWLYRRWGNRGNAVYTSFGSLLTLGLSGLLAWALSEPLVFPSLGATAFLFFETPMAEVASPRNTIIG